MNATRFASLFAASVAVVLTATGCANSRDDYAMQTPPPTTPVVAAEPMVQQPNPIVAEAPAPLPQPTPMPVATAPADPVMTTTPPTTARAAPIYSTPDNMLFEREPATDRN